MDKKKKLEDVYFPVPRGFNLLKAEKVPNNKEVVRQIIQGAVKAAYSLKSPDRWDYRNNQENPQAVATDDQIAMVIHLIESLQPTDAIEAVLASQFAITYLRGTAAAQVHAVPIDLFEFGHKVLETLQKYRSKGAQQISVQYNVNQGQVVNIKNVKKDNPLVAIEENAV